MKTRGRWFDYDTGTRVIRAIGTFHPAYLLRSPSYKRLAVAGSARDREGACAGFLTLILNVRLLERCLFSESIRRVSFTSPHRGEVDLPRRRAASSGANRVRGAQL